MPNLSTLKKLIVSALWAGLWAGLLLTALQSYQVIPSLLHAEVYEQAADHQAHVDGAVHQHEPDAWQPTNGAERTLFTALANISLAVGFALLLGAASTLRGGINSWRQGLYWGLAGYSIFFVAPSLGLPPELPGTLAADLEARQLWWLMTVFDTALGLWLLVFAKTKLNQLFGAVLLLSPHVIGAPQPEVQGSLAPAELASTFIMATAFANALFWLTLGALMGLMSHQNKMIKS